MPGLICCPSVLWLVPLCTPVSIICTTVALSLAGPHALFISISLALCLLHLSPSSASDRHIHQSTVSPLSIIRAFSNKQKSKHALTGLHAIHGRCPPLQIRRLDAHKGTYLAICFLGGSSKKAVLRSNLARVFSKEEGS